MNVNLNGNTRVTVWSWIERLQTWHIERSYCLTYAKQVVAYYRQRPYTGEQVYIFPLGNNPNGD